MYKRLKSISLILSVLLVLTAFSACGKKEQPPLGTENFTGSGPDKNAGGLPISKNKITLKVFASRLANEKPYDQMEVFAELEKRTNIHFEWQNPPTTNATDLYKVTMASGDLPDIITIMPTADILKYGKDGTIVNLSKQMDQNMPNLKNWMVKLPEVKKSITTLDGNIYSILTKILDYLDWNNPFGVRTDWIDKVGMKVPTTTDEWYNVWKAFKEKDPNGNGKADELPFSCVHDSNSASPNIRAFVTGFGVADGFYSDPKDGGRIHYGPIEDKYRDALAWLNKCYKEGLIDKDFITNDEKVFQGKVAENLVGSFRGSVRGNLATFNVNLGPKIPGLHYVGAVPIKTPTGEQFHNARPSYALGGVGTVITNKNKYVAETLKFFDYCYGEEGTILLNFGIEGKHYTMVNGEPKYTDFVIKNPEGLSSLNAQGTYSPIAGNQFPAVYAIKAVKQIEDPEVGNFRDKAAGPTTDATFKYLLPNLNFDEADNDIRRSIMTDVQTYVNEMTMKFIVGTEPLSNWSSYVSKVKGMNVEKCIPVYQKALDFWNKN